MRPVSSSLGVVETDMNEIAASSQQIHAGAETILSSLKEAASGAQQVAAVAEEAGSASAQAAAAARQAGARRRGSRSGDRRDRLAGRRPPAPRWLRPLSAQPRRGWSPRRMAEATVLSSAGSAQDQHLVVFRIADEALGFRLDHVVEIIRLPGLAHMPLAPRSLLGLANLRGAVLPIVSLRRLLDLPDAPPDAATRVIVTDHGAAVGFVVDRIDDLLAIAANQVEKDDAGAGSIDPQLLDGVVKGAEGDSSIKILNPQRLLRDEFARLGISGPRGVTPSAIPAAASAPAAAEPAASVVGQLRPGRAGIRPPARPRARDHSAAGPGIGGSAFRNGGAGRRDAARPAAAVGVVARAAGIAER
jgi:chemotaxis signal transduction protein